MTSFKDFTFGKSKSEITQSQGWGGGQALGDGVGVELCEPGPESVASGCGTEGLGAAEGAARGSE